LVGVAVNVTEVPDAAGLVPAVSAMLTDGTTEAFTVIVMLLLVAVGVVAHVELEVIVHATTAPLVRVAVAKVAEFVPAAAPFTVHAYAGALPPVVGTAANVTEAPAHVGFVPTV